MDKHPNRLVYINFVDVTHRIYTSDSITIDTRIGVKSNYTLSRIPDYACGIYLTWTDSNLDGKLPDFVGCGGQVIPAKNLKEMINRGDEYIFFCDAGNEYCVTAADVLDDKNEDDCFLVYNTKFAINNNGVDTEVDGKLVVWHLRDMDFVLKKDNDLIEYINHLPVLVKKLRDKRILPYQ